MKKFVLEILCFFKAKWLNYFSSKASNLEQKCQYLFSLGRKIYFKIKKINFYFFKLKIYKKKQIKFIQKNLCQVYNKLKYKKFQIMKHETRFENMSI